MNLKRDFHAALPFNLTWHQSLDVNKTKYISDKSQYMIFAFRDLFVCFFVFLHFFLCSNIGKCFGITLLSFYCLLGTSFRFWKPCVCVYIISYLIQDNIYAWIQNTFPPFKLVTVVKSFFLPYSFFQADVLHVLAWFEFDRYLLHYVVNYMRRCTLCILAFY